MVKESNHHRLYLGVKLHLQQPILSSTNDKTQ